MKAKEIYIELRKTGMSQWDILDLLIQDYYNENFKSNLLEDYPCQYGLSSENWNWGLEGTEAYSYFERYLDTIDFDFYGGY